MTTLALVSYKFLPTESVGIAARNWYPPSTISQTSAPIDCRYALVLIFQYTKLLPLNIGGMIDSMPSWLFILKDLPSSNQASSEGPAPIPIVGNNTERRGESVLSNQ